MRSEKANDGVSGAEHLARRAARHRLFLDSADSDACERWLPTGILHGVTTNPTILARAGLRSDIATLTRLAAFAFERGAAEFQAQVWGGTRERYERTGRQIAALDPRMVVKVPMTEAGLAAARALVGDGVRVTMTAVLDASQALVAAALGTDYAAPYHGRIGDAGRDADAVIADMLRIVGTAEEPRTRLLVASVRSAEIATRLAAAGCDTLTLSPAVLEAMVVREDSEAATALFESDASDDSSGSTR